MQVFSSDEYKERVARLLRLIHTEIQKEAHSWDDLEELIQTARYMAEVIENWQIKQHELDPKASLLQSN